MNNGLAQEVLDYLKQIVEIRGAMSAPKDWAYSSIEEFVLKNGRWFESTPLPLGVRSGKKKECVKNAADLMLEIDYTYVEGFALAPQLIPVFHAWCVDTEGKVIDPTWDYHPGTAYFGVPFNRDFVRKIILETKHYGILGPWLPYIPLLKGEVTEFLERRHYAATQDCDRSTSEGAQC